MSHPDTIDQKIDALFSTRANEAIGIIPVDKKEIAAFLEGCDPATRDTMIRMQFGDKWNVLPLQIAPTVSGKRIGKGPVVLVAVDSSSPEAAFRDLPKRLKAYGIYKFAIDLPTDIATIAAREWAIAGYQFTDRKSRSTLMPKLVLPKGVDKARVMAETKANYIVRDLINSPPNEMGPLALAIYAEKIGDAHGAQTGISLNEALKNRFPLIHAVGQGAKDGPRLIEINWTGDKDGPMITLIGKGVCFDTGGYSLKPSASMDGMKGDMAGAAHVLGLAHMIMAAKLPVRLRVLAP
ncbi:MAG: leucyl aminopeptidase family protein, partial [Pseudomonadota bacterium]|nr:leucyl aminopeptidase family protein [Pseudomonadota bacterium]